MSLVSTCHGRRRLQELQPGPFSRHEDLMTAQRQDHSRRRATILMALRPNLSRREQSSQRMITIDLDVIELELPTQRRVPSPVVDRDPEDPKLLSPFPRDVDHLCIRRIERNRPFLPGLAAIAIHYHREIRISRFDERHTPTPGSIIPRRITSTPTEPLAQSSIEVISHLPRAADGHLYRRKHRPAALGRQLCRARPSIRMR